MASIFDEYENELGIYDEKEIVGRDLDIESEIQTEITAWNNRVGDRFRGLSSIAGILE